MRLKFSDIGKHLYDNSRVLVVVGQYMFFNRLVIDGARASTRGNIEYDEAFADEIMAEFGGSDSLVDTGDDISAGSLDFETFLKISSSPAMFGRWYCCVDYNFLTKKQREKVKTYIKKPNADGLLVVVTSDRNSMNELRRLQSLKSSQYSHVIEMGYPRKSDLYDIVRNQINSRGKKVAEEAIALFVMRMSTAYDSYAETINMVCDKAGDAASISYDEMKFYLEGIENFILDDFIRELVKPMSSIKVVKRRKVYKVLNSLLSDMTPREIVGKLKYYVRNMLEYRIYINKGIIPVMVRYNCDKVKERLPEDSNLRKPSSITFKRNAYIASMTSLADWFYMWVMLSRVSPKASDTECMQVLIGLMHRGVISNDRLMNVIGVKNTLEEGLVGVNSLMVTEEWRNLPFANIKDTEELT